LTINCRSFSLDALFVFELIVSGRHALNWGSSADFLGVEWFASYWGSLLNLVLLPFGEVYFDPSRVVSFERRSSANGFDIV